MTSFLIIILKGSYSHEKNKPTKERPKQTSEKEENHS
jgi:hypothetical protein